jgi:hypothetical protein
VIAFGDELLGTKVGMDGVMRLEPSWWDWCSCRKRHQRTCCLSLCHVRTQLEGYLQARKRNPTKTLDLNQAPVTYNSSYSRGQDQEDHMA